MAAGINTFLSRVSQNGGMSFSNNFLVEFKGAAESYFDPELVEIFCDEAQLPNINTATGTHVGLKVGLGSVDYPHTRVFTEFSLTFMLDANMTILKSLNNWYYDVIGGQFTSNTPMGGIMSPNRVTRVRYKDYYQGDIHISKTEAGKTSPTERKSITYVMEKAWPYQIDAIPLQFGSSQITKVTAQFKYERHYTMENDIRSFPQLTKGEAAKFLGYTSVTPLTEEQRLENLKREVAVVGNKNLMERMVDTFPMDQ